MNAFFNFNIYQFFLIGLAFMLTACGGGSGGADPVPTKFNTYTYGSSTATDTNGNVYVAGYTNGGLDGNSLTGTTDFFLTKYDASGTKLYTKQMGALGKTTKGNSVATDTNGNVYVAGYTDGGLDGNSLAGITDFFLTKYDASGTKLYTKQMGKLGKTTNGNSVATDTNGNVYVAGYTDGRLDGNSRTGITDFFLTKYDASGAKLYTKQFGVFDTTNYGLSTATDANDNVYVGGITYELYGMFAVDIADILLAKLDSSGTSLYSKQMGVLGAGTYGNSTATDTNGNVYVAGNTFGGLDGNLLTGTTDFFLTKYNARGTKLYTKQMGAVSEN